MKPEHRYDFASDNVAGLSPEYWGILDQANRGYAPSYGDDLSTEDACDAIRDLFGCPTEVFFVFNGTAGNSLAIASLCQPYHSIIASHMAHIETDECGAPEFFSHGSKLLLAEGESGKLDPASAAALITRRSDIHYPKARVLSLTIPTECGTLYSFDELKEIKALKARFGLRLHLDGARFGNAIAALGCEPRELVEAAGADVLCFGGIKAGFSLSEAVVFFDPELAREFDYRCKQAGQLASKMRYLSAPWAPAVRSGRWLELARHANSRARELEAVFRERGYPIAYPVQANAVFVDLPAEIESRLRGAGWHFYNFIGGASRFMCNWSTTQESIRDLAEALDG